jgi:cytochrome P450
MCLYPEVQEKVHEEIFDCFGIDGNISLADDFRLPYLVATIEEISRHCPAAALGVPHETTADFSIGSYVLPKGELQVLRSGMWR